MTSSAHDPFEFSWAHSGLELQFAITDSGSLGLRRIAPADSRFARAAALEVMAALVEIRTVRDGSSAGHQNLHTSIGDRLLYVGHESWSDGGILRLDIRLRDPETSLEAVAHFSSLEGSSSVTAWTTVINGSAIRTTLLAVSSAIFEITCESQAEYDDFTLWWARNDWTRECRWTSGTISRLLLPDLDRQSYSIDSRRPYGVSGLGTWPSGRFLPMGMLENTRTGLALAWQVENPGPWRWEVGDRVRSLCIGSFGPIDNEHQWSHPLDQGESFTTVETTVAVVDTGWNDAIAELSRTRQARRRPHPSFQQKPVVFNDFMNAILGDPTEAKLLPLIDAAADVGVEVFCIDAGWFDEEGGSIGGDAAGGYLWWDGLGEYEVSARRFPRGLNVVTDRMRERGMIAGIWLEPEVIGVRSPLAALLPDNAFFMRGGERVVEHGRYHLDFSHPAARAHVDEMFDRVINDHGIGYVKLDYNINPGPGSDAGGVSPGAGLLAHGRAMLEWLADVVRRHPDLIIMNCASGGMRMDGATQRFTHVQQMSDQGDFLKFIPIAVAAPTAVPSDQAASWAYPDRSMTQDEVEFCLSTPQLSRYELSGQLDALSGPQSAAVSESIALYKTIRRDVGISDPVWPWGLPDVDDAWLCLAQRNPARTLLTVWRRSGEIHQRTVHLPWLAGTGATGVALFPSDNGSNIDWDDAAGTLTLDLPRAPMAIVVQLTSR